MSAFRYRRYFRPTVWPRRVMAGVWGLPMVAMVASVLTLLAMGGEPPMLSQAATITVCASGCDYATIRAAVNAAAPGATISIAAGTYTEKVTINKGLKLEGAGASSTVVDGGGSGPVFSVGAGATVDISGVAVQNGSADLGGGVFNQGALTLRDSAVRGNAATGPFPGGGGGIYNTGTVTLAGSVVSGNRATSGGGGGIHNQGGAVTLSDSVVSGNEANNSGAGIMNTGTVRLVRSAVRDNVSTQGGGGGVSNEAGSELWLEHSAIEGNRAANLGGGILNFKGSVTLADSAVRDNTATDGGGGIYNWVFSTSEGDPPDTATLTLFDSTVSGNASEDDGGGIRSTEGGVVTLTNSTVSGNSAALRGGGFFNRGALTLTNSTVSGNLASGTPQDNKTGGGGIYNEGSATLVSSTISRNRAVGNGGGVSGPNSADTRFRNTIILGNTLSSGGAAAADCAGSPQTQGYNLVGQGTGCTDRGDGDLSAPDAILGPLQNNGGPTQTHSLEPGSPAIDAGNPVDCADSAGNPLVTDQRGFFRIIDGGSGETRCDIGAFEFASTPGVCGDQNFDGIVDVLDAMIDLRITVGLINPTPAQRFFSDLNRDGGINVLDAIVGLQHISGLVDVSECGTPIT